MSSRNSSVLTTGAQHGGVKCKVRTNNTDGLAETEVGCPMSSSRAVDGNEPKTGLYVYVGASAEHRHTSLYKVLAKVEEKHGEDSNKARRMAAQYILINKKQQPLAEVFGESQTHFIDLQSVTL